MVITHSTFHLNWFLFVCFNQMQVQSCSFISLVKFRSSTMQLCKPKPKGRHFCLVPVNLSESEVKIIFCAEEHIAPNSDQG